MLCEPLVALLPDQPPDAVHAVALALLQLSVLLPFKSIQVGFAVNVTVGLAAVTVTLALWLALPPAPEHASVNVVFDVRFEIVSPPDVAFVPLQPPLATEVGFALNDTVGAGAAPTVTLTD